MFLSENSLYDRQKTIIQYGLETKIEATKKRQVTKKTIRAENSSILSSVTANIRAITAILNIDAHKKEYIIM